MRSSTKIVLLCTVILFVAATVLVAINYLNADPDAMEAKIVRFYANGEEQASIDEESLLALEAETFQCIIRSSGEKPVPAEYTGVQMAAVFEELSIDTQGYTRVLLKAVDGYTVAVAMDEIFTDDNVYIAYEMNGEAIKTKKQGGNGPYQLVIRKDPFSQRWCKYLVEVELQ